MTTDPLQAAIGLLDEIRDSINIRDDALPDEARVSKQMRNDRKLVLVDWYLRAAAVKSVTAGQDHPPVPEQAATEDERELIEANMDWWEGWRPGAWPVTDRTDGRGFRWEVILGGR